MYQILQNPDNDLLLVIEPQDCEPDGPMFIYDGGDTALLFRDWFSNIRLNHPHCPRCQGYDDVITQNVKYNI